MRLRLTNQEFATLFCVPVAQIEHYKKKGMPDNSFYDAVRWYFEQNKGYVDGIVDLKKQMLELQLAAKSGKLLKRDTAKEVVSEVLSAVKEELLCVPGSVTPKLEGLRVAVIHDILTECVHNVLNQLSDRVDKIVLKLDRQEHLGAVTSQRIQV